MSSATKKEKIIRIIARLNVGGPARHVVWLTKALQSADFETKLIAGRVPEGEEDMGYFAAEHGVIPEFIDQMSRELSLGDLVALWKIWRILVREKPDIVHTHTAKAGTLGRTAAFLYRWFTLATLIGRPRRLNVFHTFHGHIFHGYYGGLKTRLFLTIERVLARIATDLIVVISAKQRDEIHDKYRVGSRDQFRIVPLGLDLDPLSKDKDKRQQFRQSYSIGDEELAFGIVGRLTEVKNHRLFIEAAANLEKDSNRDGLRFVIIGDGHLRGELEALSENTGIIFAGNLDDAAMIYSGLDGVVLTSVNEGTPLTLIEAMAFGLPWIASNVGGVGDLAGESKKSAGDGVSICERGIVYRSKDVEDLTKAIGIAARSEELRRSLGDHGREYVVQAHGLERLIDDLRRLYNEQQQQ